MLFTSGSARSDTYSAPRLRGDHLAESWLAPLSSAASCSAPPAQLKNSRTLQPPHSGPASGPATNTQRSDQVWLYSLVSVVPCFHITSSSRPRQLFDKSDMKTGHSLRRAHFPLSVFVPGRQTGVWRGMTGLYSVHRSGADDGSAPCSPLRGPDAVSPDTGEVQ